MRRTRKACVVRNGLTLIEVSVSLILVSTILLVSITASANLMRNSNESHTAIQAYELAGVYLDEISTRSWIDDGNEATFGLEPDEDASDRNTFDDVDDYHAFTQSPPTFRDGQAISGFANWSVSVSVSTAIPSSTGVNLTNESSDPLRLVTVTCTSPVRTRVGEPYTCQQSILVSDVSGKYDADQSYEKIRQLDLAFPGGREMTVVAPLRNHPSPATN